MNGLFKTGLRKIDAKAYIMLLSLIAIAVVFTFMTDGIFLVPRNISNLARQTTIVGILAIGMMFVIVAGHIDLSVGSLLGFCGTLAAVLQVWYGWDTIPTILVVVLAGILLGLLQGYTVSYLGVPAFIVTLGGLLVFKGMKLGLSKSASIAPMNPDFTFFGQGYLPQSIGWMVVSAAIAFTVFSVISKRNSKKRYGFLTPPPYVDLLKISGICILIIGGTSVFNSYQGIPVPVLILLVLAFIFSLVADKTVYGRSIYAIGGNLEASELAGIRTKLLTMIVFAVCGMLAALAGIVLTARLDASTSAAGDSMELDAIAACVIGGTSLAGGIGKVAGVLIGALIMASLNNGMSLINLENFWQFVVKGLVLVLAVWADTATKKKR